MPSSLDIESSSDDDGFFAPRAFPKKKVAPKKIDADTEKKIILQRIAAGQPISTSHKNDKKRKQRKRDTLKSKEKRQNKTFGASASTVIDIDDKAHKAVDELKLDVADKIISLNNIGWIKGTKKQKYLCYPAIVHGEEDSIARILLKDVKSKSKVPLLKVQIIGSAYRYANKYDKIPYSRWIPFTEGDNEKLLLEFLKHVSKQSHFKDNLFALKVEEFVIQKIWRKVRDQEEREVQRRKKEEEQKADASASSVSVADVSPAMVSQEYLDPNQSCSSDSNDDDESDNNLPSPGRVIKKRTRICLNDEIEFYNVMATHGDPLQLQRARVVGIKTDKRYPLILSNTIMLLPSEHLIRILPDGNWQPINTFILRKSGKQSIVEGGMRDNVERFKKVGAAIEEAAKDYWKNQSNETNSDDKAKSLRTSGSSIRRCAH